jgi:hypothetical protein
MCAEEAAMHDSDAERLDRQIDRISNELPSGAGGFLRWLRGSSSRWVRAPVGLLLIVSIATAGNG